MGLGSFRMARLPMVLPRRGACSGELQSDFVRPRIEVGKPGTLSKKLPLKGRTVRKWK